MVEKFFDTTYMNFLSKFKYLILLVCISTTSYAGYRATEIRGLTELETYFRPDHFLVKAYWKAAYGFNDGDIGNAIVVDIMWGMDGISKKGVDGFNASQVGSIIWDK